MRANRDREVGGDSKTLLVSDAFSRDPRDLYGPGTE